MIRRSLFCFSAILTLLLLHRPAAAQAPKLTLSGTVKDAQTGEDLGGATVRLRELPAVDTAANAYGVYSLTVPAGTYTVEVSFVGYQPQAQPLTLGANQKLDFRLSSDQQIQEVVVMGRASEATISRAQMGVETLNLKQVAKVPVLFGEKDVLKTLQLLPGVKSGGEGNGGFFVRGGSADQNLILLDEAPVYNASHLLGFFSTFNSDALRDVTVYKGNMPAQYGGRLSSVVDVKMKDGNSQKTAVNGGIGVIASRLAVEGPIGNDEKGSFLVAGRRTYADVFLKLAPESAGLSDTELYFYDLNAKANYRLNANNRLYLSGYLGRDVFGLSSSLGTSYGNQTATLRWNHLFSDRLFSNTSLIYSNYDYKIDISSADLNLSIQSKIKDYNFKQDYEWYLGMTHTLRFGLNAIHHTIRPGQITGGADSGINPTEDPTKYSLETAAYVGHEWQPTPQLTFTTGLRLSGLSLLGSGNYNRYDAAGALIGTTRYDQGEIGKTYLNLEPRVAASYQLAPASTLKASYARNVQNIHLLSNSATTNPTDIYLATTLNVKPETADQLSLGYYRTLEGPGGSYSFSTETYYKWLGNQIDYRDGTELRGNQDVEADLLYGTGRAYGVEFLLKKETGRLTGWLGYTYSRTERQFTEINGGDWFAARHDKPHDVSVVAVYQLTPRWSVAGTFVASTGNAVTFPVGKYRVNGQVVSYYGARNADRLPAYQRLDLSATYEKPAKEGHRFRSSWNFSLYNALGRQNPYSIRFEMDDDDNSRTKAVQTALFRWVPSVTYNFSF